MGRYMQKFPTFTSPWEGEVHVGTIIKYFKIIENFLLNLITNYYLIYPPYFKAFSFFFLL